MASWVTSAGRSTSSSLMRVATRRPPTTTSLPSVRSQFRPNSIPLRQSRIPAPHFPRLLRRELSSLLPVHSAVSAACLVSKLPAEATSSAEGRFANYLSPI